MRTVRIVAILCDDVGVTMIAVENPATEEVLGEIADSGEAGVNQAVAAARAAFAAGVWARKLPSEKEAILWRIGDLIERDREDLALLVTLETGKTLKESRGSDVGGSADAFRYFAGAVRRIGGRTIAADGPFSVASQREAMGVVGAIVPWNYPLCLAAWKIAPALACGNSVLLKPSELTPFHALKLAELLAEAGVPPGVFQVVNGYGHTTGEALARHMDVDKISFTGSTRTGRRLLLASAESNLKPVSLELGGKSANIVFGDADPKAALRGALWGIFSNQGQICTAGSRLLVQSSLHDEFVDRLVKRVRGLKMGDPRQDDVVLGSLISKQQMERVLGYIKTGKAEGANLVCGGAREGNVGCFVQATVFSGVKNSMRIAQEEIFGPVLSVIRFETEEEALAIANGTSYGLAAAVWTSDLKRANRMASALHAGTVWVNSYNEFDAAVPFGGVKQSGFGRELGQEAIEEFTTVKSIWTAQ
ncbi:aldehyde dehydrogenase family protein [Bryobacter aggregatus]|uniref:aldehyde dehydrogenase family protein n=1 Tax=Bryobacter aggregatus TaxID=360054 RepID=UPI0004E20B4C|nr:aldehyde dehydrogenase family protein [Bryobacter aggregatus]